jgi:hypothetical protein
MHEWQDTPPYEPPQHSFKPPEDILSPVMKGMQRPLSSLHYYKLRDMIESRETPALHTNPETVSFGDVSHLPDDPALLRRIDWEQHLPGSAELAPLPGHPEVIARIHNVDENTPEGLLADAKEGIRHLGRIADAGIIIGPHRFFASGTYLISLTDRLDGQTLSDIDIRLNDPEAYIAHSQQAITAQADYLQKGIEEGETILYDKAYARQHTILPSGVLALHDTGLDFAKVYDSHGDLTAPVQKAIRDIINWSDTVSPKRPSGIINLKRLLFRLGS